MADDKYDAIIIGAGPAGLFAAYELKEAKVLVIEEGLRPLERVQAVNGDQMTYKGFSNILQGVGGAGLFSDGKLNFIPTLGKTDLTEFLPRNQAQELIDYVEKTFARFEMDSETYPRDMVKAANYYKEAKKLGLDLLLIKQKHIGTDMLPNYINEMVKYLETCSVTFLTQTKVVHLLEKDDEFFGVQTSRGDYFADNVIVAPGRSGANWWYNKALELDLKVSFRPVEIGVRVEVPEEVMREITEIIYDPTLFLYSETYDDQLRTFCTNRRGFVIREDYEDFFCVNGSAYKNRFSHNTNFALLSRVNLTEPVTDTYLYGASIGRLATSIGGGKPLLQRYIDLEKGRRSTWDRLAKAFMEPTQKDVTPGDISMAMPKRIVTNLLEGIRSLDRLIPGLASASTLFYAPEIKFFSTRIECNRQLETKIKGLYIAGDGTGVSGNLVGAAATGIIAARDIKGKLGEI